MLRHLIGNHVPGGWVRWKYQSGLMPRIQVRAAFWCPSIDALVILFVGPREDLCEALFPETFSGVKNSCIWTDLYGLGSIRWATPNAGVSREASRA